MSDDAEQKTLKDEIKGLITEGWTSHERSHWDDYLEEEVKPYYPILYKFLKSEGLVAQFKKMAKWRVEENLSTEIENRAEVTRLRSRQYLRLDEVLGLLGVEETE